MLPVMFLLWLMAVLGLPSMHTCECLFNMSLCAVSVQIHWLVANQATGTQSRSKAWYDESELLPIIADLPDWECKQCTNSDLCAFQ